MIYSTILSEVRLRTDDGAKLFSNSQILRCANDVLDDIAITCEGHIKHAQIILVDDQRLYALPNDVYELRGVRINGSKIYGTHAFNLEDFDTQYLNRTGYPSYRYYLEGLTNIGFYPQSNWTSDYTTATFSSEFGVVTGFTEGTTDATFTSEFGVITDIISTTGSPTWLSDSIYGELVALDISGNLVCMIAYAYRPARLVNDSDVPDLQTYMQWCLIYGILEMLFTQEGQGQSPELALYYGDRYKELKMEWRMRNLENEHGQDQYVSQKPVRWGSDLDWRDRVFP